MAISKYQAFETQTIHRSQIKNAEYNPRYISQASKNKLKKSLRDDGLVSALTWNKKTGNLVGGHQRLSVLDALEKSNDYDLTVCVVNVDEREEAKLNIHLNNPQMQGEWDADKLAEMSSEFDLSLEDIGFDKLYAEMLFDGDERFSELYDTPDAEEEKGKLQEIKAARSTMNENLKEKNSSGFYAVIVFSDEKKRNEFFRKIHVPNTEQYITEEQVERLAET